MGERKVINKYYPPDFDPEVLERSKPPKTKNGRKRRLLAVRMMLPMSVRCQSCGEYMYKGKKFNSQKETVEGEDYCGVEVYRLYFKCVRCKSVFTIKTDPRNADYVCEMNVTRNVDPRRDEGRELAAAREARRREEADDVMKRLENQSRDAQRELSVLQTIEDLKSIEGVHAGISGEAVLERRRAGGPGSSGGGVAPRTPAGGPVPTGSARKPPRPARRSSFL